MTGIESVNSVAIVPRGRGGESVRVLDSASVENTFMRRGRMKSGFLSLFGIGKAKDTGFKFSDVLFGGIAKVKALDAADSAGIEKAVGEVMSHVVSLGDSEAKEVLTGAVSDCLRNAEAVLAKRDDVAKKIDELYGKCRDADVEAVKRILDADTKKDGGEDKEKDKEKEEEEEEEEKEVGSKKRKEGSGKDAMPENLDIIIAAAIDKAFGKFDESVEAKIDAAMKKALGAGVTSVPVTDSRTVAVGDSAIDGEDTSYMVRGLFANR
jgi:hypothetical protein